MFSLKQQLGTRFDGSEIELKQWQILFEGVLVGYLPQTQQSQIQALFNFPHDKLTKDVLAEFAMVQESRLGVPDCVVTEPEQASRAFVEEAFRIKAEEDAEDDE